MIEVEVHALPGTFWHEVAFDLCRTARNIDCVVYTRQNDKVMRAYPWDDAQSVCRAFADKYEIPNGFCTCRQ